MYFPNIASNVLLQCKDHPERPEPLQQPCVARPQATPTMASRSQWHETFSIPDLHSFSPFVKNAIENGVVTGRAKREIIQVLRTYITAFTMYPKPEQYTIVCKKLVEKYPLLGDDTDEQCKYVSWIYLTACCKYKFCICRLAGN